MSAETDSCQFLEDYLAGELDDTQKFEFKAHLASCETCAEEMEVERNLDLVLSRVTETIPIPASLQAGVATRIPVVRIQKWYVRVLLTMAATVLLAFFSSLVFNRQQPEENLADRSTEKLDTTPKYKLYDPSESIAKIKPKKPKTTIAVSYPTKNSNITMVFLYPETTRKREESSKETSFK